MTDEPIIEAAEPTVEDSAREMGWRPKEEFKGDPDKWVEAETFVKRGEEILPILKANSKKLEVANAALKAEMAETKKAVAEFKQYHSQTEKRAYERAMKDLEARQAQAVQDNDLRAVREITREMTSLSKDVRTDDSGDLYATPDHAKTVAAWQSENTWFGTDVVLTGAADAIASDLEARGVRGADQLAEVAKRIKAEFPHKFENARRSAPAAVEGGSPPRKAGKGWSDLPPEAKAFAERMVKQGLITKENYAKDYFA
jgi:hypothetical protein